MACSCPSEAYCPSTDGAACHEGCPLGPEGFLRAPGGTSTAVRRRADTEPFLPVPGWRGGPVAARTTDRPIAAVVALPGPEDERAGFTLAGPAGMTWTESLRQAGRQRADVDVFPLLACRPPGPVSGAWLRMDRAVSLAQKQEPAVLHPTAACRPRLWADLAPYHGILALGSEPWFHLTGDRRPITAVAGTGVVVTHPLTGRPLRVFALPSPLYVTHAPGSRPDFVRLLAKGIRFIEERLHWVEPVWRINPTASELRAWWERAKARAPFFAVDCETTHLEPIHAALEFVQIGIPDLDANGQATTDPSRIVEPCEVVILAWPPGMRKRRSPETEAEWFGQPIRNPTTRDVQEYAAVVRELMTDPSRRKVGANVGYYDALVLQTGPDDVLRGDEPQAVDDLLINARFRAPDMPKGLKPNGVLFLDVDHWESTEAGERALWSQNLHDVVRYAGYDAAVSARLHVVLRPLAHAHGADDALPEALRPAVWPPVGVLDNPPWTLHALDHERQRMCRRMYRRGVAVDQRERAALCAHYEASVEGRKRLLGLLVRKVRGTPTADMDALTDVFNPNSAEHLRKLLYEDLRLDPPRSLSEEELYTESGELSTGSVVLRAFLAEGGLDPDVREIIVQTRLLRRERGKVLGTFLWPLDPRHPARSTCLSDDGRVRGAWNATNTEPGRLSCGGFPLQIIGSRKGLDVLKRLFVARPDDLAQGLIWQCHDSLIVEVTQADGTTALLGADLDQAHLRIMANHWKIPKLQECFTYGWCPYSVLADTLFGDAYRKADGWGPDGYKYGKKPGKVKGGSPALAMRETAKAVRLALAYKVAVPTATATIMSTEYAEIDPATGQPTGGTVLPFLNLEIPELRLRGQDVVRYWADLWLRAEPEWETAWQAAEDRFQANGGFLVEPVLHRRTGSLDGGKPTKIVNTEILSAEASIMALAERAVEAVFDPEVGDGLALVPQEPDRLCRLMEDAMCIRIPGWEFPFTAEAKVGLRFSDV